MTNEAPLPARDVRVGEKWTARQRLKNDVVYALVASLIFVSRLLPERLLLLLGRTLGSLALWCAPRARTTARQNLERVFPRLVPSEIVRLQRATFLQLGENVADALLLLRRSEVASRRLPVARESRSVLDQALSQKRGALYVTAHLGPWERMGSSLVESGYALAAVTRQSYDPRLDRLIYWPLREGRRMLSLARGSATLPVSLLRALRRNSLVGILVDLPGRVAKSEVVLLGQQSHLSRGVAQLALRTRVPLLVGTPARSANGTLQIAVERVPYDDLDESEGSRRVLLQRIADILTVRILSMPEHWAWMHPSFADGGSQERT